MTIKGNIQYSSPSNIAIIKYWGKAEGEQIPMNPSVSMTLDHCRSFTSVQYEVSKEIRPETALFFEGHRAEEVEEKTKTWLKKISSFFPWIHNSRLHIETRNNFPHSAGIASSASGMSALAMCITGIDRHVRDGQPSGPNIQSHVARLGSGSASRSVMGPWAMWGHSAINPAADNEYAVALKDIHQDFNTLCDTIIVVDNSPKSVSSRAGHALMNDHPWRFGRIAQAESNLELLFRALQKGDWPLFEQVTENEALSLHALMLASRGGMMLWKGKTVEWMHYLREQREKTGIQMAFTLDAGANIHLLYPYKEKERVTDVLEQSPVDFTDLIHDQAGPGPEKLLDDHEKH